MSRTVRLFEVMLVILCLVAVAATARSPREGKKRPQPVQLVSDTPAPPSLIAAVVDTAILAAFDFDDLGGPDPQGWTSVDLTAQSGQYWHVDDFAGLGGGTFGALAPIDGSKSLWCGARPGTPDPCSYATWPGYGNDWIQTIESVVFGTSGDVTIEFDARFDSEAGYDYTTVEYESATGAWYKLADHLQEEYPSGAPKDSSLSLLIPADSLNDEVRFRITFRSDEVFSDEDGRWDSDGAVIIDNLRVGDDYGFWESQDFETETIGDTATADGHWFARSTEVYGDYAALFDGASVLQEDPGTTNLSYMWGFFNGSTYDYSCGSHPEQQAVPYGRTTDWGEIFLHTAIQSPWISLLPVAEELAAGGRLYLDFDIYRDLPMDNLVFYYWEVRADVSGCPEPWNYTGFLRYGDFDTWFTVSDDITDEIPTGTDQFQVRLYAIDMCEYWCGTQGSGDCHSHAPLYDNVFFRVYTGADSFYVTNTDTIGPGSLYDAIQLANVNSTPSTILFNIPGPGPHVISSRYGFSTPSGRTIIEGRSQPGYTGTPLIVVEGLYQPANPAGIHLYEGCEIYGVSIRGYDDGIVVYGSNTIVDGCEVDGSGMSWGRGIYYYGEFGVEKSVGLVQDCIIRDFAQGIYVSVYYSGNGYTFRRNSIYNNTDLGIDLGLSGGPYVNPNDPLDADTGANDLQNYPDLDYIVVGTPGAVGGSLSTEPNETCVVDFYASPACHSTGYGEGEIYLGSKTVVTDATGNAEFHASLSSIPSGHVVTATATNSQGSTSEFSACCSNVASVFVVTNTLSSGPGSFKLALDMADSNPDVSFIRFNISGAGPHIIRPTNTLILSETVIVDGFTQPGAAPNTNPVGQPDNAVIQIEIDGGPNHLSSAFNLISGTSTVIRGLAIYDLNLYAVYINPSAAGTRVEGCRLGTNAGGMTPDPIGTGVLASADGCVIGGSTPEARNIISACTYEAVEIPAGSGHKVWGNYIGVAADGVTPMNNLRSGVFLGTNAVTDIQIGGLYPGQWNIIANNARNGVTLANSTGIRQNPILGNSIYGNSLLGIDLGGYGVTPNDPGDVDSGPNDLQNYPVVNSVTTSAAGTRLLGSLNSTLNDSFRLEFFASDNCDPTGYGEGQTYLGSDSVQTDPGPDVSFDITSPVVVPGGVWITATATDSQGNTSEFSQCFEFINTAAGSYVVTVPPDENGGTPMTLTFENVDVAGNTMLSTSGTCDGLPGSFVVSDPMVCYDVSTDATFTGMIEVCVEYDEDALAGDETNVRLTHWDDTLLPPDWVDVTTSVDTDLNIVCGEVSHLSPFVVGTGSITGMDDRPTLPTTNALHQNVPNPFNPVTTIRYNIVDNNHVRLNIYDVAGRLVRTLVNENQRPNYYEVSWDGTNDTGQTVATGIYFYRLTAGNFIQTRKMLLLK